MTTGLPLAALQDEAGLTRRLREAGLSAGAAGDKARLFASVAAALPEARADPPPDGVIAWFVPGRIEVLGKHTDYAGGRSLLAAAERGFCVVAAARTDRTVTLHDAVRDERIAFEMDADLVVGDGWAGYPMTVARRVARNFAGRLAGADVAFASDLPPAAGMSSSSALVTATFLVLRDVNRLDEREEYGENIPSAERLAEYLGTIENGQSFGPLAGDRGVGTFGGSEDHTAILCCRAGRLSQYAFCPVRFERHVDLPGGCVFAVAASGVLAEKTGAAREKYNRASRLADRAAAAWREATGRDDPHLAAAVGSGPDAPSRIRDVLGARPDAGDLAGRFEHFLAESEQIIPLAGDFLAGGDVGGFGRMADLSQRFAERLLGNQVPETAFLARSARQAGAVAASAFGAGFGGGVWALIDAGSADAFRRAWCERYAGAFPDAADRAEFFTTAPGPAAVGVCRP